MLKPEDYQRIVRASHSGMSMREISRRLRRSRESVRKVLNGPVPRPRKPRTIPRPTMLDPFLPIIAETLWREPAFRVVLCVDE